MADTELKIVVAAKNETRAGLAAAERDVRTFGQRLDATLKSMKGSTGDDSALGGLGKIAVGGGAIAAVTMLGRVLNDTTSKAVELKEQFQKGGIAAEQIPHEIGKSIPIFGQLLGIGADIHELFTGDVAEMKAINAQAADTLRFTQQRVALARLGNTFSEQNLAQLKEILRQEELIYLTGMKRSEVAQRQAQDRRLEGIDAQAKAKVDKIEQDADKMRADRRADIAAKRQAAQTSISGGGGEKAREDLRVAEGNLAAVDADEEKKIAQAQREAEGLKTATLRHGQKERSQITRDWIKQREQMNREADRREEEETGKYQENLLRQQGRHAAAEVAQRRRIEDINEQEGRELEDVTPGSEGERIIRERARRRRNVAKMDRPETSEGAKEELLNRSLAKTADALTIGARQAMLGMLGSIVPGAGAAAQAVGMDPRTLEALAKRQEVGNAHLKAIADAAKAGRILLDNLRGGDIPDRL